MWNLSDGLILAWGLLISQSAFSTNTPPVKAEEIAINTIYQVNNTLELDKKITPPVKKKVDHHIDSDKEYDRSIQKVRAEIIKKVSIHVRDFNFWVTRDMKDLGFWWINISLKRKISTNEYIPNSTLNLDIGTWVVDTGNKGVFIRAKFNF